MITFVQSLVWLSFLFLPLCVACRILVPQAGIEPRPLQWKCWVLTTGLPRAFPWVFFFLNFTILYWFCHISTWICHRYTRVPHPEPSSLLPPCTIPLDCPIFFQISEACDLIPFFWNSTSLSEGEQFVLWCFVDICLICVSFPLASDLLSHCLSLTERYHYWFPL